MFQSRVLKIMIASPGDVPAEREMFHEVVNEWNAVNAESQGTVLLPIDWKVNSSPEVGGRPQELLNTQLLRDADLLVAVFWTRAGTPTGMFKSGTIEEIEEHLSAGKPALIYFSSKPIDPSDIDEEQYGAVTEFKESLKSRGLFAECKDTDDFRNQLSKDLAQTIIRKFPVETPPVGKAEQRGTISSEAVELLMEASKDYSGVIRYMPYLGGASISTNNREFTDQTAKTEALWRGAIQELERTGQIEDRTGEGKAFYLTALGYKNADEIERQSSNGNPA